MEWSAYSKMLREKCKKAGKPYSATFELTPLCNFNCNMCYIHLSPEQLKHQGRMLETNEWIKLAEEAKKNGVMLLEITGGEAVTRADFPELYKAFHKMGFMINLRSNGYLLSGERIELLKKYKPRRVSISLYGASNETYEKICGIKDGFSVVEANIFALLEAGISVQLTGTLTKENMDDRLLLHDWAAKNNLFVSFFGGLFTPIGEAKRSIEHLRIDSDVLSHYTEKEKMPHRDVTDREKYSSPFWMCNGFGTKFCISWDGHMTLCNCLPCIWSNPLKEGVLEAFRSLNKKLNNLQRPNECAECEYIDFCGNCPARLYSDAGDPEKTCDKICAIAYECYDQYRKNKTKDIETNTECDREN